MDFLFFKLNFMDKPNYWGLLPASVRYDLKIKPNAKILYTEIWALSNTDGWCRAQNNYFAELYKVDPKTISRWISQLYKRGHIDIHTEMRAKNNSKRFMRPVLKKSDPFDRGSDEKITTGSDEKIKGGSDEKITHNNTSINNNSIVSLSKNESGNAIDSSKLKASREAEEKEKVALKRKRLISEVQVESTKTSSGLLKINYLKKNEFNLHERLAIWCFHAVKINFDNKVTDKASLDEWAKQCRLCLEDDSKRTPEEFIDIFWWAINDKEEKVNWQGWFAVIKSPKKFREKYDDLKIKCQASSKKSNDNTQLKTSSAAARAKAEYEKKNNG